MKLSVDFYRKPLLFVVNKKSDFAKISYNSYHTIGSGQSLTTKKLDFDFQSYGELTWRDTNFDRKDFASIVGWWENRVVLRYKSIFLNPVLNRILFEPYGKITLAASENDFPWENNSIFGIGIENRFFDTLAKFKDSWLNWMYKVRIYAEFLTIEYTKDDAKCRVP